MSIAARDRSGKWLSYIGSAVSVLNELSSSCGSDLPYLKPIVGVVGLILDALKSAKTQSDANDALLAQIHETLCVLTQLCASGADLDALPTGVVERIGNFAETLQKFATVLRAQQGQGRIRRLLKSSENTMLLVECKTGLDQILRTFSLQLQVNLIQESGRLQDDAERRHQQLLALLSAQRERSSTIDASSLSQNISLRGASSTSLLSLLPAAPKIFHGREAELASLVDALVKGSAKIAILGAGGMGKTTLVTAALHHDGVAAKYPQRYFVGCEVANTVQTFAAAIASHLGIKQVQRPVPAILRQLKSGPPTLLVLDNLETAWEIPDVKNDVEELLSSLSELSNLSLVVTMRGAERPGKVLWSRPHIPPLSPLADEAARGVFLDIADDSNSANAKSLERILEIADNLPLALNLLGNLVAVDGYDATLARWDSEKTRLISDGYDKRTSLEISLQISLSSPRLTAMDGAMHLLSLLSILPSGLSDAELVTNAISDIRDPYGCRTVLLQTALAYVDRGRLKVLAPVRAYVFAASPPSPDIIRPLRSYYCDLIQLWWEYGAQSDDYIDRRILGALANISAILTANLDALERGDPEPESDIRRTLHSAILFNYATNKLLNAPYKPWYRVVRYLDRLHDDTHLRAAYVSEKITRDGASMEPVEVEQLVADMFPPSNEAQDMQDQAEVKLALAVYHGRHTGELQKALEYAREAMSLSKNGGNTAQQFRVSDRLFSLTMIAGRRRDNLTLLREIESVASRTGQLSVSARVLYFKGLAYKDLGYLPLATTFFLESWDLHVACGIENSSDMYALMDVFADAYYCKTEFAEARAMHVQLVHMTSRDHSPLYHAIATANIALVDILTQAREDEILQHLAVARDIFTEHRFLWGLHLCDIRMADLQLRRGDRIAACEAYQALLATSALANSMRAWCLSKFASPEYRLDESAPLTRWPGVYIAQARKIDDVLKVTDALRCFADVFLAQGDVETATRLFELALEEFTRMDVHRERAVCFSRLAAIRRDQNDLETARGYWKQAKVLYERSSQFQQVKEVDFLMEALDEECPTSLQSHPLVT
ncbi:NB-ARC domain-containing protein [Mycena chlorophos]|uniref:NB-ARC domain-containing protein n=1 Tax=Mycena chlorophos TaxID=658473 RepID=A0A8H6TKK1_MYCCL|nr:NB-ARC domain-containing protein [Mycena chlorophos]